MPVVARCCFATTRVAAVRWSSCILPESRQAQTAASHWIRKCIRHFSARDLSILYRRCAGRGWLQIAAVNAPSQKGSHLKIYWTVTPSTPILSHMLWYVPRRQYGLDQLQSSARSQERRNFPGLDAAVHDQQGGAEKKQPDSLGLRCPECRSVFARVAVIGGQVYRKLIGGKVFVKGGVATR